MGEQARARPGETRATSRQQDHNLPPPPPRRHQQGDQHDRERGKTGGATAPDAAHADVIVDANRLWRACVARGVDRDHFEGEVDVV